MFRPITDRIRHLVEAAIHPAWRLITFVALDLVGGILTLRDELAPDWLSGWRGLAMIHITWPWWLAFTFAGLFVLTLEGSYRVRCRIEQQRDDLQAKLDAIGLERGLSVSLASFAAIGDADPEWAGLVLNITNVSDKMIRYTVEDIGFEFNGTKPKAFGPILNDGVFLPPHGSGQYTFESERLPLPQIPFTVVFWFTISYDNVPPVKRRTTYRKIKHSYVNGGMSDRVLEQDER